MSPHDPKTLYAGAEVLFRSKDRGDSWEIISPDLTTNDPKKISVPRTTIQHCTITTISESPVTAGVIWVGTDDGNVQVTRDAGKTWTNCTDAVIKAGSPGGLLDQSRLRVSPRSRHGLRRQVAASAG